MKIVAPIFLFYVLIFTMTGCAQKETLKSSSMQTSSVVQQSSIIDEVSSIIASSSAHGTKESKVSLQIAAEYAPVLESWSTAIKENFGYDKPTDTDYPFILNPLPNEFSDAHYVYYDIDSNGVPELLIASFADSEYCYIGDIFTIHMGKPVRLFAGVEDRGFWSRNTLDFSKDGKALIVSGSGGAFYTDTNFYKVAENGYQVKLIEGLTTYNPNNDADLTPYYRNSDGKYIIATDIDKVMEKYYAKIDRDGNPDYDFPSAFSKELNWQSIALK